MDNKIIKDDFKNYLLDVDRYNASKVFEQNFSAFDVIEEIVVPSLQEIGDGWESGEYSLSQVYMSSVICEELVNKHIKVNELERVNKKNIAIVTFDDYHTLGKRIVCLTLRSNGYEVSDFGMIFDLDVLLKKVKEEEIEILFMSVLMLPPALKIKEIKPKLLEINPNLKIIVGGAPFRFDNQLYKEIGADGMGSNPYDAIKVLKELEGI